MSSVISQYSTWFTITREKQLGGPRSLINAVSKNTYLMGDMLAGRKDGEVVQSGSMIVFHTMLDLASNFGPYVPGTPRTPSRGEGVTRGKVPWRFNENHFPYTDADILLNEGDEEARFISFRHTMMQILHTAHYNGLENQLSARPNSATMESLTASPGAPYSIPCFVSENSSTYLPPSWSTIHQIDPATKTNWRNYIGGYNPAAVDGRDGIFMAMHRSFLKIKFNQPPNAKQYFESDNLRKLKILTNLDGHTMYAWLLQHGNDRFMAGAQDPAYGSPVFLGVPVTYWSNLDSVLLDETAGSYTGTAYPEGYPRYFMLNLEYLYPIFHTEKFMDLSEPKDGGATMPDAMVIYFTSWYNLVCTDRRRHAIICPT